MKTFVIYTAPACHSLAAAPYVDRDRQTIKTKGAPGRIDRRYASIHRGSTKGNYKGIIVSTRAAGFAGSLQSQPGTFENRAETMKNVSSANLYRHVWNISDEVSALVWFSHYRLTKQGNVMLSGAKHP
jgi:hypothetical protein